MEIIINWLETNIIEVTAAVLGLLYIFLSIRQNIALWAVGMLGAIFYIYVFYGANLYADMVLQVYYVLISIYGWYNWLYGAKSKKVNDLKVRNLDKPTAQKLFVATLILYVILAFALVKIPPLINIEASDLPYLDAFTTAGSFVATWMLTRKILENWIFWIVIDAICVGMYIYKGMNATVVLFIIYTILAVNGYLKWKKEALRAF